MSFLGRSSDRRGTEEGVQAACGGWGEKLERELGPDHKEHWLILKPGGQGRVRSLISHTVRKYLSVHAFFKGRLYILSGTQ